MPFQISTEHPNTCNSWDFRSGILKLSCSLNTPLWDVVERTFETARFARSSHNQLFVEHDEYLPNQLLKLTFLPEVEGRLDTSSLTPLSRLLCSIKYCLNPISNIYTRNKDFRAWGGAKMILNSIWGSARRLNAMNLYNSEKTTTWMKDCTVATIHLQESAKNIQKKLVLGHGTD